LTGLFGGALDRPLHIGDVYTLGHAVLSALHLVIVGRLVRRADPYVLNAGQLTVMALLAVPVALVFEGAPDLPAIGLRAWLAFGYLAVFSSTLALLFQIRGQQTASASAAAVIMLVESPIGALFAIWLLNERMSLVQVAGAVVLMSGVLLSVRADLRGASSSGAVTRSLG
jgi:drug/metabolite transporter (DMT)-like permease